MVLEGVLSATAFISFLNEWIGGSVRVKRVDRGSGNRGGGIIGCDGGGGGNAHLNDAENMRKKAEVQIVNANQ